MSHWITSLAFGFLLTWTGIAYSSDSRAGAGEPTVPLTEPRYYMLIFGSQAMPKLPKYTHSWATVVKVAHDPQSRMLHLESHTISWMPVTLNIHALRFHPEPGVNLELHETIWIMKGFHERLALWGPFEIREQSYYEFLEQKARLESGRIGYQCIDTVGRGADGSGCSCIHAITDMDRHSSRRRYPLCCFGEAGSRFIVQQGVRRGLFIEPHRTHDWLLEVLDLCKYPILRRSFNP